jgi:indoleamine 2,3-dioxygenase
MLWTLHEFGFLPNQDPVIRLDNPVFEDLEQLGADLPLLVHERTFRSASADYFLTPVDWDRALTSTSDPEIERLFVYFSYFASAYIHAPGLPVVNRLPSFLAVPLVRLAQKLERPPILSYASYCLHNWRRLDRNGPIALGNIALLQNFSLSGDGKEDEDWFILVHVDIEARTGLALNAVHAAQSVIAKKDVAQMHKLLETTAAGLTAMNKTMMRMPEGCSAEVYFRKVRPYIFGFTEVIYDGCFGDKPQSYRGETGAQSSIVPTMLAALGVVHKDSLLTQHLRDMQNYMPRPHREFISQQVSVREFVIESKNRKLAEIYNECLRQLIVFRSRHLDYAVNYIEKKESNPIATGGTPYMPWLHQLIEETKAYFLGD